MVRNSISQFSTYFRRRPELWWNEVQRFFIWQPSPFNLEISALCGKVPPRMGKEGFEFQTSLD
jgi:hypothetical protein